MRLGRTNSCLAWESDKIPLFLLVMSFLYINFFLFVVTYSFFVFYLILFNYQYNLCFKFLGAFLFSNEREKERVYVWVVCEEEKWIIFRILFLS